MKRKYISLPILFFLINSVFAQNEIPNYGFEEWVNSTQPGAWSTGNTLPPFTADAITQTSEAYEGQSAARGEIMDSPATPGLAPWLPLLSIGSFGTVPPPVTKRYTHLKGYYKIVNANEFQTTLQVQVNLLDGTQNLVAVGQDNFNNESGDFTEFSVFIDYGLGNSTNDPTQVQITINLAPNEEDASFGVGSYFILDALELTGGDPTSIEAEQSELPQQFELNQNYPNPFNPATKIQYSIPVAAPSPAGRDKLRKVQNVTLKVYDTLGNEVATLVNEHKPAGTYEVNFDASNLSSGLYLYTLSAGGITKTNKMMLIK